MQNGNSIDRRGFLHASVGAGVIGGACLEAAAAQVPAPKAPPERLPREVWVASLSLHSLEAQTHEEMIAKVLRRLAEIEPMLARLLPEAGESCTVEVEWRLFRPQEGD